ncbi:MAG: DUF1003 domain-containing protein [Alphaproteobacteria bacterium]|jgi:uncharacterized membrane protein|uniref:DUF1003 domain-containing protein n=1 Tax=Rhodovarius sp. TaxID=2972673 RepID=UPI0034A3453F|nr:DUF1003 domain-containing protein [Alphaproteobacteria bacterium]
MQDAIRLTQEESDRLRALRLAKPARQPRSSDRRSMGERVADLVALTVGSWRFIIIQSLLLALWILLNITAWARNWDPYPFILLNLVLSFQAAYAAPIVMMSQNRQAEIDRRNAAHDYQINIKAELEIELLHTKIDAMREQEIARLTEVIEALSARLSPPAA